MNERERSAVEALLVSRLRSGCGQGVGDEKHSKLTDSEKKMLACMQPGYIQELLKYLSDDDEIETESEGVMEAENTSATSSRQLVHGLNRADEIDQSTAEELDRNRDQILDQLREERRE